MCYRLVNRRWEIGLVRLLCRAVKMLQFRKDEVEIIAHLSDFTLVQVDQQMRSRSMRTTAISRRFQSISSAFML